MSCGWAPNFASRTVCMSNPRAANTRSRSSTIWRTVASSRFTPSVSNEDTTEATCGSSPIAANCGPLAATQ